MSARKGCFVCIFAALALKGLHGTAAHFTKEMLRRSIAGTWTLVVDGKFLPEAHFVCLG